jgi:chemotaxis protein methyltransferase CheR
MQTKEFSFSKQDFRFLAELVNQRTGIVLTENKSDLVYGRLAKRLRKLNLSSFAEYCELIKQTSNGNSPNANGEDEIIHLTNALTTNHTGFYREPHHFDYLEKLLGEFAADKSRKRLRLWSAASSIGAEAYSMAMCVMDVIPDATSASRDIKILGTDIDTQVIERAAAGVFPLTMAEPIPAEKKKKYLKRDGENFIVHPSLKAMISYKPLNLLDPWPMKGPFDIVFCRNVVIYFDKKTQATLFDKMADVMTPDGILFIGHSETMFNVCDRFELIGKTTYKRVK